MKLEAQDIELLEAYWSGELAEPDRKALEERLLADAAFKAAAAELRRLQKGLHEIQRRHWKDQLAQIEQQAPALELAKPVWWHKWWVVLSGALLLILLFVLWQIRGAKPKLDANQAIAQAAFDHFPYYGATLDSKPADAIRLYEEDHDYVKGEKAMQTLFQETQDSTYLLYAAIAAVGSNQGEKAVPILEELVKSSRFEMIREDLEWYLALGYLEMGEFSSCLKLLQRLNSQYSSKKEEIQDLIKKIKILYDH